ncbi:GntR family transcriptional regulator [Acinetobacter sp. c1-l78]|uniref:GntR family transcriptional regulator n=1 Tax=Acinetobacter sp. c1-l78 TaxID=3342803 RepID=UPI0035B74ECE
MNMAQDAKLLTLAEQAYRQIQTAIVYGDLPAGSKILEAELAKTYGISRGPLREAIHRLEAQKLLQRTAHVGTRVVSLSEQQLIELYQIRANLEGLACRLTAEKRTPEMIAQLQAILALHAQDEKFQAGKGYYLQEKDDDFHYCIIHHSGNAMLKQMLCDELYHIIRMYRIQFSNTPHRPPRALFEHQQILAAIAEGDGALAEILMQRHIMASCRNIQQHLPHVSQDKH